MKNDNFKIPHFQKQQQKDSGQAGMTIDNMDSRLRGNDGIHSGASGPANGQVMLIKMTLNTRKRYQSHNMSLPMSLLVKGIKGRSGWGMGIKRHYLFWGHRGKAPVSYPPPPQAHPDRLQNAK
jgi:hypothetical protein